MKTQLIVSLKMLGILTVLLGMVYPLLITGFAHILYKDLADGSLIVQNDTIRGSSLISQQFDDPAYFSPRPSATGYVTLPSGGSNLSLTSKALHETVMKRKEQFIKQNKLSPDNVIPSEMVFASASGVDPHISPAAASLQINRIAEVRKFSDEEKNKLIALVNKFIEKPQFGIFGEARVNVLLLNLKLDEMKK